MYWVLIQFTLFSPVCHTPRPTSHVHSVYCLFPIISLSFCSYFYFGFLIYEKHNILSCVYIILLFHLALESLEVVFFTLKSSAISLYMWKWGGNQGLCSHCVMPIILGGFPGFSACIAIIYIDNSIIYEKKEGSERGKRKREKGEKRTWGYFWSLYSIDIFTCTYGIMF